ncbi:unnamed protein product [Microthlaspi erraticum]|uniref:Uncharacterized protein n=1 Tax=Microthlaspi erraticum TaxID=1685480 RepID=A0A6D2JIY2_9BRAS|nr:unnamed protein product [Microthlaspi erraticum]
MKWYIQGLVFGYLSAPQRTGRLGRGLEMETAIRSTPLDWGSPHSIELAAPLLLFFISKWCGFLGLGGAGLLELLGVHLWRSPGKVGSYSNPDLKLGLLQVNSTVSSIELSFLCLDSIESGGRAGASGLRVFLLLCVLSSPSLARKKRLCEALGQGASLEW